MAFLVILLTGAMVPVNRKFSQLPDGIPVFVVSNGFHTDIVVPLREERTHTEWLPKLAQPGWDRQFATFSYVALGWGSEPFLLASAGGRFPGPGSVARAVVPGPALMHVRFLLRAPVPGKRVVALRLSEAQYGTLTGLLEQSFALDSGGQVRLHPAPGYTPHDFFFRATGRYHALHTCNDWTVATLRRTGIRVPLRSPLAAPIVRQLRRAR